MIKHLYLNYFVLYNVYLNLLYIYSNSSQFPVWLEIVCK